LTGGQRWWDNILGNIRDSDIIIFALSPQSWESEACRSELAYAQQLSKVILPVLVADGIHLNLLPAPINQIQVTDYRRCDKEAAFALVKPIHTAPASPPLPEPLPPTPAVPVSYLSTLKERIDSHATLNAQEQIALMFELEGGIRDGRSPTEMKDLLLSFKRRDDLLAKVATRIDEALAAVDHATPAGGGQQATPVTPPSTTRPEPRYQPQPHVAAPTSMPPPSSPPRPSGGAKVRRYACRPEDGPMLIDNVKRWLDGEGFDSQQMSTETGGLLL